MSHICDCVSPCNCIVDEDGIFSNRASEGRRNTVVSGSGSFEDPIVIQFQHSEFYRPPAAQQSADNITLTSGLGKNLSSFNGHTLVTVYQSPTAVLAGVPISISKLTASISGHFFLLGASATFPANSVGVRTLGIYSATSNGTLSISDSVRAGQIAVASSTRKTFLSCTGFSTGLFNTANPLIISDTRTDYWAVGVGQNSGGNLNVETIKFWVATI